MTTKIPSIRDISTPNAAWNHRSRHTRWINDDQVALTHPLPCRPAPGVNWLLSSLGVVSVDTFSVCCRKLMLRTQALTVHISVVTGGDHQDFGKSRAPVDCVGYLRLVINRFIVD
jgi:hypothetical protein